jgi:Tfp pilus assembly protein PilW
MKRTLSIVGNEGGLSLIELIVTMALVIIVLTMNTDTFGLIMRQSKQQTQEAAGAMDRIVGLEMLRRDAELAGFGLPWSFGGSANYAEATGETPS